MRDSIVDVDYEIIIQESISLPELDVTSCPEDERSWENCNDEQQQLIVNALTETELPAEFGLVQSSLI